MLLLAALLCAAALCAAPHAWSRPRVQVVQTDDALSQRLAPQTPVMFSQSAAAGTPVIHVDPTTRYQRFAGLGAAMTDSSAWLIGEKLSPQARWTLLQQLFGQRGIALNFIRVPMGASDFTVGAPYTYDDAPPGQADPTLRHFSIDHDRAYILPTLHELLQVNPGARVLANPWTPPAWMKTNDALDNATGNAELLPSAYGSYARYFVDFIRSYEASGVSIDAITPQNEPSSGDVATPYPGLTMPAGDEGDFVDRYLAPALRAAGLRTAIFGNDLSWVSEPYAQALASGPAANDLAGLSWHCYFGTPTVMSDLHQTAPQLDQIVDECSPEIRPFGTPELVIASLRNWASVVALWNLALDTSGGPKQALNGCIGCKGIATIDTSAGTAAFGIEYYQLGQISRFVAPGAVRIGSENFVSYSTDSNDFENVSTGLDDVAFRNPDGSEVLIAYDNSMSAIPFTVESDGRFFTYTIPSHAMTTFRWAPVGGR